jgi:phosphoserine phosphatase
MYPIDGILSTIAESDSFVYTGNLKGSVCNGDEKLLRASDILKKSTKILSIGYGDSVGDYPLLKACDIAYIIKHRNSSKAQNFKRLINLLLGKIDIVESKIEIEKFS